MRRRLIRAVTVIIFGMTLALSSMTIEETYVESHSVAIVTPTREEEPLMPQAILVYAMSKSSPGTPMIVMEAPIEIEEDYILPDEDYELIARIAFAEAGNQSELGIRLVIDVIYNRMEHEKFPDNVYNVAYERGQFTPVIDGTIWRYPLNDEILEWCKEELNNRTNNQVLYFRTKRYHSFGLPLFQEGAHFFSGL